VRHAGAATGIAERTTYMTNKLNQYEKCIMADESPPFLSYDADATLTSEYGLLGGDSDCSTFVDFNDINYFVAALAGGQAGWTTYYQDRHNQQYPPCQYLPSNDVNGDVFDLLHLTPKDERRLWSTDARAAGWRDDLRDAATRVDLALRLFELPELAAAVLKTSRADLAAALSRAVKLIGGVSVRFPGPPIPAAHGERGALAAPEAP
jgi:hypothetical protein